jgi:hypothetical protein
VSTISPTTYADRLTVDRTPAPRPRRTWALAGLGAGVAGMASIAASLSVSPTYDPDTAADPLVQLDYLADKVPNILVFHTATMLTVVLLLVVSAGIARRLRAQGPADSLLPAVAAGGLMITAVAGLMGAGLTTEFVFGLSDPELLVPENATFFGHWIATIPWLWVGVGVTAMAVAVAAIKHAAAPRWIGWVSVVLGGLTLLFGISPLQYMAGFVGPVWLTVVSLGFLLGDRRH